MKVDEFRIEADKYLAELEAFIAKHNLPAEWFKEPDHLAVKGADGTDYEAIFKEFTAVASQASYIEMSGRRLGTVKFEEPFSVGKFGTIEWLEIMEPRPERVGSDVVGLEHMEFYFPDFESVEAVLKDRGIAHELQTNPGHTWLNILINDRGQELKINNRMLGVVVVEELEKGITTVVK